MLHKPMVASLDGRDQQVEVLGAPDACPICHHRVVPTVAKAVIDGTLFPDRIQAAYLCPNRECGRMFIAIFKTPPGHKPGTFFVEEVLPGPLS